MKLVHLAVILAVIGLVLLAIAAKRLASTPKYKAMPIMTPNELDFFVRILEAVPGGYVFPQVAMSALIRPDQRPGKGYMAAFGRIAQKRVDYAVYDARMGLLAVIELDDRTHNKAKDAERDAYLASAGIKTLRFESRHKPTPAGIQAALLADYQQ